MSRRRCHVLRICNAGGGGDIMGVIHTSEFDARGVLHTSAQMKFQQIACIKPMEKIYSGEASYPCRPTEQPGLIWDTIFPARTGDRLIG